jgi:hypothetical protein
MLATWHASAKLRLHTETTLAFLEQTTTALGRLLRRFVRVTCSAFHTTELPQEQAARGRRNSAKLRKEGRNGKAPAMPTPIGGPKRKLFNLNTFKLHSLGDYANHIRRFGTSDSYSTQIVCDLKTSC